MNNYNSNNGMGVGISTWIHGHTFLTILIIVWSLFWTGLALWHSVRRGQFIWFVVFLLAHTLGILEIIYLFGILKLKFSDLFHE